MIKFFKILFIVFLTFSCSSDDNNDKPLCSDINIQNPNDGFIPCDDPESVCRCG